MRLIDADKLEPDTDEEYYEYYEDICYNAVSVEQIRHAPTVMKWNPIDDCLPKEKEKMYLVTLDPSLNIGYPQPIDFDTFGYDGQWRRYGNSVIAWMELPDAYIDPREEYLDTILGKDNCLIYEAIDRKYHEGNISDKENNMINVGDKVKVVINMVDDNLLISKVFTVDYIEKIIGTTLYTIKDAFGNYYKILPEYIEKYHEENENEKEEATIKETEEIDNVPSNFIKITDIWGDDIYINADNIIGIKSIHDDSIDSGKSCIYYINGKYIETRNTVKELFDIINKAKVYKHLSERSQFFKTQV